MPALPVVFLFLFSSQNQHKQAETSQNAALYFIVSNGNIILMTE